METLLETGMEIEFNNDELKKLEMDSGYNAGFGAPVVRGYRKVLSFIRAASDERDFRSMRSLNFEKLQGDRCHQCSLRINGQWRLIVEIKKSEPKNIIVIIGIEDYH